MKNQQASRTPSHDPYTEYDARRVSCPVAHSERLGWELRRHADILRALHEHKRFSNRVSHHLTVPNGMDPPEHTPYRLLIEPYFSAERMRVFEPRCRALAAAVVEDLPAQGEVEIMSAVALRYAVRVQCAFLGWPAHMEEALRTWAIRNQQALRDQNRTATAQNAHVFEDMIGGLLHARRIAGARPTEDLTAHLLFDRVGDRPLNDEEITSILRNWTAGEVATLSASIGLLVQFLAEQADLQELLRKEPSRLPYAIDEILRIRGPLPINRRVTTCAVKVGSQEIPAQEPVALVWLSGNRDEQVFEDPLSFRWDRDPSQNLLYGAGLHVCPGAPLARLQQRVFMEELLASTESIALIGGRSPLPADYPAGGFSTVPLRIVKGGP